MTAANQAAVDAYDRAVGAFLRLARDSGDHLKAALADDPAMVMANCLRGYFMMLMGKVELLPRAVEAAAAARAAQDGATLREQAHVEALERWTGRDMAGAADLWEAILLDFPRDILAARLAHYAHFYSGDNKRLRDSINRVMPAWDAAVPGYSNLLGMQAFGFEEAGDYARAEATAEAAIDLNPDDTWAIHAYAHVMEMQDRHAEGLAWLERLRPYWSGAHNFRYHVWWHEALFMLDEGRHREVLAMYDESIFDPDSDEYLDLCNDVALLQRLEILGLDVGERWAPLADKALNRTQEHLLTYVDAHYALALAAANPDKALEMREFMESYEGTAEDSNLPVMKALGVPLVDALIAYRAGRYGEARDGLMPIRYELWQVGGSHAQRDLFNLVLIDTAMKAEDWILARALLAERRAVFPDDPWTAGAYDRVAKKVAM